MRDLNSKLLLGIEMVTYVWRKSSFSGGTDGNCVELRLEQAATSVRDSKSPVTRTLTFGAVEFQRFLAVVKRDEFEPSA